jgi:hypothetical protein
MWPLFLLRAKGKRKEMTGTQHVGTLKHKFLQFNRSSNELRNDFAAARPTSKQQNRCLESWHAPIVSLQASKRCLEEKLLYTQLFDTGPEMLLKTLLEFGEFPPRTPRVNDVFKSSG